MALFRICAIDINFFLGPDQMLESGKKNNNTLFWRITNTSWQRRTIPLVKSQSRLSRNLLIASSSARDGLVVPAIHILRVALKTPILLAILGMLMSDSSTNLLKSIVSACSLTLPKPCFLTRLRSFDLCVHASTAIQASLVPIPQRFFARRARYRPTWSQEEDVI